VKVCSETPSKVPNHAKAHPQYTRSQQVSSPSPKLPQDPCSTRSLAHVVKRSELLSIRSCIYLFPPTTICTDHDIAPGICNSLEQRTRAADTSRDGRAPRAGVKEDCIHRCARVRWRKSGRAAVPLPRPARRHVTVQSVLPNTNSLTETLNLRNYIYDLIGETTEYEGNIDLCCKQSAYSSGLVNNWGFMGFTQSCRQVHAEFRSIYIVTVQLEDERGRNCAELTA
jgi:hypothetical protein